MIEAKPENLIGDRAYDSDPLDAQLRKDGIEMMQARSRRRRLNRKRYNGVRDIAVRDRKSTRLNSSH